MPGFSDRLAAAKAKNTEAQERKAAESKAAEAAEAAKHEKLGELGKQREGIQAELSRAEAGAEEARNSVAEADAYVKEQGDALDAEAKAEIDAIKAEAGETIQKFEALKAELAKIDAEISAMEGTGEEPTKAKVAEAQEQSAEAAPAEQAAAAESAENKAEKTADETFAEKRQELLGAAVKGVEDIPDLSQDVKGKIAEDMKAANRIDVSTSYSPDLVSDSRWTKNERFPKLMQLMNPEIARFADRVTEADTKLESLQAGMGPDGGVLANKIPADMKASLSQEVAAIYKQDMPDKQKEEEVRKLRTGKYAEMLNQRIQSARNERGSMISDAKSLMKNLAGDENYIKISDSLIKIQQKWNREFAKAADAYHAAKKEER